MKMFRLLVLFFILPIQVFAQGDASTPELHPAIILDLILLGGLITFGLYHLSFFIFRSREKSAIFFGLLTLSAALRIASRGSLEEIFFSIEPLSSIINDISYVSIYIGLFFFWSFIYNLFHQRFILKEFYAVGIGSGILVLLTFFTPPVIDRIFLYIFGILFFGLTIHLLLVFIRIFLKGSPEAGIFLIGFNLFLMLISADIFHYHQKGSTLGFELYGIFILIFFLSLMLSHRFTRNLNHMKGLLYEMSQLKGRNEELEELSNIDPLTEIPNRRRFDEIYQILWRSSLRSEHVLSIIFIDIDCFKLYNDHYGHQAGDVVIQKVAKTLEETLMRPEDMIARYGGEEFVALLPDADLEGAKMVAKRMEDAVCNLKLPHAVTTVLPPQGKKIVTISQGISSIIPGTGDNLKDLIETADQALYEAKKSGRNQIKIKLVFGELTPEEPVEK